MSGAGPQFTLKSAAFRAEREASWRRLETLLGRLQKQGLAGLSANDLARLPVLYRATLSSLSVARAISLDRNLLEYLETLSARAYLAVYGTRRHLGQAVWDFFAQRFPRTVRNYRWYLALAAIVLALGTAAGWALTFADSERFYGFVGAAMAQGRGPTSSTESLRSVLYDSEGAARMLKTLSMFLFSHNSQVGLLAFAIGAAGAIPAALLLFTNGLGLGAFAALYGSRGLSLDFWGWILPHGVTELTAVALCGAAGLVVGGALIFPGREERLAGLARRGREAGVLVLGAVAMFFVSALIEGLFRQLVHSVPIRYSVASLSAAVWIAYFHLAGRERPE
ncbi:MAG TPA: stage II sporulation protein M [Myxococcaceae bacterium]|nr:stage II sporulation protein M [Myxococcaceae bacterium]